MKIFIYFLTIILFFSEVTAKEFRIDFSDEGMKSFKKKGLGKKTIYTNGKDDKGYFLKDFSLMLFIKNFLIFKDFLLVSDIIVILVINFWCPRPDSNWHSQKGKDFKSFVSTNFTTRAYMRLLDQNKGNCTP